MFQPDQDLILSPAQPFPLDGSIWSIALNTNQTSNMSGTNIQMTLKEGQNITVGRAQQVIIVAGDGYQC
jgi:hypothetical protein